MKYLASTTGNFLSITVVSFLLLISFDGHSHENLGLSDVIERGSQWYCLASKLKIIDLVEDARSTSDASIEFGLSSDVVLGFELLFDEVELGKIIFRSFQYINGYRDDDILSDSESYYKYKMDTEWQARWLKKENMFHMVLEEFDFSLPYGLDFMREGHIQIAPFKKIDLKKLYRLKHNRPLLWDRLKKAEIPEFYNFAVMLPVGYGFFRGLVDNFDDARGLLHLLHPTGQQKTVFSYRPVSEKAFVLKPINMNRELDTKLDRGGGFNLYFVRKVLSRYQGAFYCQRKDDQQKDEL